MISQNYAIKYSYENFDYFGIVNDTWKIFTIVLLGSGFGTSMKCVSIL